MAVAVGVMAFGSDANAQAGNIALNRPTVTSSSQEGITGNYAVDGDGGTRWGSLFTANEWIYVDLGASTTISRVVLTWETAYAIGYKVQTSPDAATWTDIRTITDGDGGVDDLTVSGTGRYIRILGTVRGAVDYGYSLWEFAVYSGTTATGDLAKNRPATASTVEGNAAHLTPGYAVDGNTTTRWSSDPLDGQWIRVDLGSAKTLGKVVLNWEGAYPSSYAIEGSTNDSTWSPLATNVTDGAPGRREVTVSGSARYVRIRSITRGTGYGISLWDFEVYAPGEGPQEPPPQTTNQTIKLMFPELAYAKINVSPAPISVTPTPEEGNTTPSVRNPPGPFTYNLTFAPNTTITLSKNQFSPTAPNTDIRLAVTTSSGTVLRGQSVTSLAVQGAEWKVEIFTTGGPPDGRDRTIIPDPYQAPAPPAIAGAFAVVAPANNAMVTNTRRPTFQWAAVAGAANYKLYLNISRVDYDWMAAGSLLDRYTLMTTTTGTSFTLTQDLPDRWTYKWYVVATQGSGATSRSDLRQFSVYLPVVETAADGVALINGMRDLNKNGVIDPYEDWHNPIATRVNDLMARMTTREKALQMFYEAKTFPEAGFTMGPLSPEDIVSFQRASAGTRLGIPNVDAGDSIHGYKTSWPTQPALAASRDLDTVYELGDMQRREQLAVGSRGTLSPLAEVGTKVLYPRIQEGNGEDADLSAGLTRALIAGLQGGPEVNPHSIWVTTKHWPGQGAGGEAGITYDGTTIHYHMRPWHAALEAGTSGIMPGYAGSWLLGPEGYGAGDSVGILNYLRVNLGYQGVICSDWLPSGAWTRSATAGSDVMGGANPAQMGDFETAVPIARINDSVRRILDLKFRLGIFEDPYRRGLAGTSEWHTADHKALARRAAQNALTLLKNDGALPLRLGAGSSIVIAGPCADSGPCMVTWRSDFHGTEFGDLTIYQAIKQRAEAAGITVYKDNAPAGVTPNAAIVVVGESYFTHGTEWDKEKPYLPGDPIGPAHDAKWGNQYGLITGFRARNIPTTTVLILPRPYILTNVVPQTNALLAAYRPGDSGGPAVADILFGDVFPRGKLPWQLPRGMDQIGTDVENNQLEQWDLPFDLGATAAERATIKSRIAQGLPILPIYGNPLFQYGAGIQGFGLTDATPPTAFTLLTPAPGSTITTRPNFTWTASSDPQTGIHRYEVFLDGSPFPVATTRTNSAPVINAALGNGAHTWFVRAYNWAGGVTQSATATFTLNDTAPPAAFAALVPAAGAAVPGASTTFIWEQTTDVGAGVSRYVLVVDGADRTPDVTPKAYVGPTTNLALGKNVSATSSEFGSPNDAVDGNITATRWSSRNDVANPDTESITVDLGGVYSIKRVNLYWEAAFGRQYAIEASVDGTTWRAVYTEANGNGAQDDLLNLSGVGRYVRMRGIQRATGYGYSLWEFEVYGVGTEQTTLTGLATGSHTWRVRAVDGANNSTLSSGPITFTK